MADPRLGVRYDGIAAQFITFKIDNSTITYSATSTGGSAMVGLAVEFSAADTVALTQDGAYVVGKLISVTADNYCVVQTGGIVTLPAGGSASLTQGKAIVGDLDTSARGYIREAASGTAGELVLCRGAIYNAAVTTAVVIKLD